MHAHSETQLVKGFQVSEPLADRLAGHFPRLNEALVSFLSAERAGQCLPNSNSPFFVPEVRCFGLSAVHP